MVGSLIKLGLKSLKKSKKLTQRQRDLKNARSRIIAAEKRRAYNPELNPRRKGHTSKRMKELIKKGTLGKIDKQSRKGSGAFIGQKNPGRGVGRWDYRNDMYLNTFIRKMEKKKR